MDKTHELLNPPQIWNIFFAPRHSLLAGVQEKSAQVSHSVDCGAGHFFCWECLGEAHAPATCHDYQLWLVKCASIDPGELHQTCQKVRDTWTTWSALALANVILMFQLEDAASCLWLVTNSKVSSLIVFCYNFCRDSCVFSCNCSALSIVSSEVVNLNFRTNLQPTIKEEVWKVKNSIALRFKV